MWLLLSITELAFSHVLFLFLDDPQVAQDSVELSMCRRLTLNSWFSCLYLSSVGIKGR